MLELNQVDAFYGKINAVSGISLVVPKQNIVTILGANGAGKSTILRRISGLIPPSKGVIKFMGMNISNLPPEKIVRQGISHVPEGRDIFPDLSTFENLRMGAYAVKDKNVVKINFLKIYEMFPVLEERKEQLAGTLSGGEQQMLAISRALMSNPKLLMLDEPSLGLAPLIVETIFQVVKEINHQGTSVLLVEQNANMALQLAQFAYVFEKGKIAVSGTGAELLENDYVKDAYLGGTI
jgi:branched-chain amino acid transport system ATP-binding protein